MRRRGSPSELVADAAGRSTWVRSTLKRTVDVVVGLLLGLALLPVMVLGAVVVTIALRASPFFLHQRLGANGRPFRMPKLRTLPPDVSVALLKPDLEAVEIPGVCEFLRRHHLDELPQLFLVVRGRLSLVGPRPKMPDDVEPVSAEYGHARVQVAQGCTGLWQIGRDSEGLPGDAPEYDYFYLQHASFHLDAWILWRTALLMVGIARPIDLREVPRSLLRRAR